MSTYIPWITTEEKTVSVANTADAIRLASQSGETGIVLRERESVRNFLFAYYEAESYDLQTVYGVIGHMTEKGRDFLVTLLVKDQEGLRILYDTITRNSQSGLSHPIRFSKEELERNRDRFLIGATAERNEIAYLVQNHEDWRKIKEIAAFYDFVELCDESPLQSILVNEYLWGDDTFPVVWIDRPERDIPQNAGEERKKTGIGEGKLYQKLQEIPSFPPLPEAQNIDAQSEAFTTLVGKATRAVSEIYGTNVPESVRHRLWDELYAIDNVGGASFFLAAANIAEASRKRGYPVCCMSNAAGAYISYLLNIGMTDPLSGEKQSPIEVTFGIDLNVQPGMVLGIAPNILEEVMDEVLPGSGMTRAEGGQYRERYFFLPEGVPLIRKESGIYPAHLVSAFPADELRRYGGELVVLPCKDMLLLGDLERITGETLSRIPPDDPKALINLDTYVDPHSGWQLFEETNFCPHTTEEALRYFIVCTGEGIGMEMIGKDYQWVPVSVDELFLYFKENGMTPSEAYFAAREIRYGKGFPDELLHKVPLGIADYLKKIKRSTTRANALSGLDIAYKLSYYACHYPEETEKITDI